LVRRKPDKVDGKKDRMDSSGGKNAGMDRYRDLDSSPNLGADTDSSPNLGAMAQISGKTTASRVGNRRYLKTEIKAAALALLRPDLEKGPLKRNFRRTKPF
jgi:hypothetical protein